MDADGADHPRRARAVRRGLPGLDALSRGHRGRPHRGLHRTDRPAGRVGATRPTWACRRRRTDRARLRTLPAAWPATPPADCSSAVQKALGGGRRVRRARPSSARHARATGCALRGRGRRRPPLDGSGWRLDHVAPAPLTGSPARAPLCAWPSATTAARTTHVQTAGARNAWTTTARSVDHVPHDAPVRGGRRGRRAHDSRPRERVPVDRARALRRRGHRRRLPLGVALRRRRRRGLHLRVGRAEHRRAVGEALRRTGR